MKNLILFLCVFSINLTLADINKRTYGYYNGWEIYSEGNEYSEDDLFIDKNGKQIKVYENLRQEVLILDNLLLWASYEDARIYIYNIDNNQQKPIFLEGEFGAENPIAMYLSPTSKYVAVELARDGSPATGYCIFEIEKSLGVLNQRDCLSYSISIGGYKNFKWISEEKISYERENLSTGETEALIQNNIFFTDPQEINYSLSPFTDLPSTHSLYNQVLQSVEEGWIAGYPDQTIRLENTVNRAEFAKMLALAFGNDQNPQEELITKFADLELTAWYRPFLAKAVELGLMAGYPDGSMKPAQTINAAEASKMVL